MVQEIDRSDFSQKEINKFSLKLRCCYHLNGWNKSADIKTVDDWINTFWAGWLSPEDEDETLENREKKARDKMYKEWRKLYLFAVQIMIEYG